MTGRWETNKWPAAASDVSYEHWEMGGGKKERGRTIMDAYCRHTYIISHIYLQENPKRLWRKDIHPTLLSSMISTWWPSYRIYKMQVFAPSQARRALCLPIYDERNSLGPLFFFFSFSVKSAPIFLSFFSAKKNTQSVWVLRHVFSNNCCKSQGVRIPPMWGTMMNDSGGCFPNLWLYWNMEIYTIILNSSCTCFYVNVPLHFVIILSVTSHSEVWVKRKTYKFRFSHGILQHIYIHIFICACCFPRPPCLLPGSCLIYSHLP